MVLHLIFFVLGLAGGSWAGHQPWFPWPKPAAPVPVLPKPLP
jgi:hypothetical protein